MLLVDKLTNATVSNGILRISCASVAADGSEKETGEILIPVSRIGNVMGELNTVVKKLREQAQAHLDARAAEQGEGQASFNAQDAGQAIPNGTGQSPQD